jgi:mono/diheme cytochrome c family protein
MNEHLRRTLLFAPCLAIFWMLVWAQSTKDSPLDSELYQRGIKVYLDNYCGVCHELAAAQTLGRFGPSHDEAASLASLRLSDASYGGEATTAEAYLRESIVNPRV